MFHLSDSFEAKEFQYESCESGGIKPFTTITPASKILFLQLAARNPLAYPLISQSPLKIFGVVFNPYLSVGPSCDTMNVQKAPTQG